MKKTVLLGFAVGLLFGVLPATATTRQQDVTGVVKALNGSPTYLGTVAVFDGGTTNNFNTPLMDGGVVTPFDAGYGNQLLIQCDQATWIRPGTGSSTSSSSSGVKIDTDEKFYLLLKSDQAAVAIKPTSAATGYCDFYVLE